MTGPHTEEGTLARDRREAIGRLEAQGYQVLKPCAWWKYPERALLGDSWYCRLYGDGGWWDHPYIVLEPGGRPVYVAEPYMRPMAKGEEPAIRPAMLAEGWRFEASEERAVHCPGKTVAWWLFPPYRSAEQWAAELWSVFGDTGDPDVAFACGERLRELGVCSVEEIAAPLCKRLRQARQKAEHELDYEHAGDLLRQLRSWQATSRLHGQPGSRPRGQPGARSQLCPNCGRRLAGARVRLADGTERHESCLRPGCLP